MIFFLSGTKNLTRLVLKKKKKSPKDLHIKHWYLVYLGGWGGIEGAVIAPKLLLC